MGWPSIRCSTSVRKSFQFLSKYNLERSVGCFQCDFRQSNVKTAREELTLSSAGWADLKINLEIQYSSEYTYSTVLQIFTSQI